MRNTMMFGAAAVLGTACFVAGTLTAGPGDDHSHGQMPEMNEEMAAWMEAAQPGKHHDKFDMFTGQWKQTIKHWMEPGSEPMIAEGTYTAQKILGGRYLKETIKSVMFDESFEGHNLLGYDNIAKEYVSVWIDNFGTGFMIERGQFTDDNTLVMKGEMLDAVPPHKPIKVRSVIKMHNDDKQIYTMYMTKAGEREEKVMEITSKRM